MKGAQHGLNPIKLSVSPAPKIEIFSRGCPPWRFGLKERAEKQ